MQHTYNPHIIKRIKDSLKGNLPGVSAHLRMLPQKRKTEKISKPNNAKQSGVLLLLFPMDDRLYLCFIRRSENMKVHGGQIAFPGGRYEITDRNLIHTAVRETQEEIGLHPEKIKILGELTPLYVSVSNFYIKPVVGWYKSQPEFSVNTDEVTELITLPLDDLADGNASGIRNIETESGELSVPCYMVNGHTIWGATAMILSEFLSIYNNSIQDQASSKFK